LALAENIFIAWISCWTAARSGHGVALGDTQPSTNSTIRVRQVAKVLNQNLLTAFKSSEAYLKLRAAGLLDDHKHSVL
jgi:hypothetical protein